MRLTITQLESRDTPSVYDMGGGGLHLSLGHELRVFEDYTGPLVWLQDAAGITTVAPAPDQGGGPRVATLDAMGHRTKPDYFAADPSSRAGVVLVNVGGLAPPVPPAPVVQPFMVPNITRGNPSDPNTWVIVLDFQNPNNLDWLQRSVDEAWRIIEPLGNVALVTRRPNEPENFYGTVVIGVDLSFIHAEGQSTGLWATRHSGDLVSVSVDARDFPNGQPVDPIEVGELIAHEIGHALGLPHSADSDSVMVSANVRPGQVYLPAEQVIARENAAQAQAITREWLAGLASVVRV